MAGEQQIDIEVITLDGEAHKIQPSLGDTVASVRHLLADLTDQPVEGTRLVLGTTPLHDGETVGSLGLPPQGATLTLVRRERLAVSGGQDGELRLWSLDAASSSACKRTVACPGSRGVLAVCATWAEMLVLCGYKDGRLQLWDLGSTSSVRSFDGHTCPVRGVAADWASKTALSGSEDKSLRLWDIDTGACQRVIAGDAQVLAVSTHWATHRALAAYRSGLLRLWDIRTGGGSDPRALMGHEGLVSALDADWLAARAVSGGADGRLRVWDLESGECLLALVVMRERRGSGVGAVALDWPRQRAVTGSADASLRVWDLAAGQCLRELGLGCPVAALALLGVGSPDDGEFLALCGSSDRRLRLWDLSKGECCRTLMGHASPVTAVAAAS